MAPSIGGIWKTFWHTMTSYDRHASHNSPYRTNERTQPRHSPLTSITTNANGSRTEFSTQESSSLANSYQQRPLGDQSPALPYTPGMRSAAQKPIPTEENRDLPESEVGEIQMQNFADGLPPPPPVAHSWQRIDTWAEAHYEELFDNLGGGCTQNDINELEYELDCTLPLEVRDSLQHHDGQERGGLPTGIVFGCMLLDCEEIVQEWRNWRQVNEQYLSQPTTVQVSLEPPKAFASSSSQPATSEQLPRQNWQDGLLSRQDSQPPNAVQKVYAHPGWIPLARDWGGNCLAVDLAPAAGGKWGQVILMGRDYDCKYVVARSWAAFLAVLADDLASKNVSIVEETGDLKLLEFKEQGVEPPYLEVLRWRTDQKYGRKGPRKRPNEGQAVGGSAQGLRPSPYPAKGSTDQDRGRTSQRPNGKQAEKSASRGHVPSPLARVTEEGAGLPSAKLAPSPLMLNETSTSTENLISPVSPMFGDSKLGSINGVANGKPHSGVGKENTQPLSNLQGLGVKNVGINDERDMTTVDI